MGSDLFVIAKDGRLLHIWQEPGSLEWRFDEVAMPVRGVIEEFDSYDLVLTIYDTNGKAAPLANVKLYSGQTVNLIINGQSSFLEPEAPWVGYADFSGRVTVSQPTVSLGVPPLKAWSSFLPAGYVVAIDPRRRDPLLLTGFGRRREGPPRIPPSRTARGVDRPAPGDRPATPRPTSRSRSSRP